MKLVFIGSGNLATHLSQAMKEAGHNILQVYSKTKTHAYQLANILECEGTDDISAVKNGADAYIISIKDDAIEDVIRKIAKGREDAVFMHTAGSVEITVLARNVKHAAVLYPMQSFTKGRSLNFKDIPFFVEATDDISKDCVLKLAKSVSDKLYELDSDARKKMHLAAVFASNLSNHCYRLAEKFVMAEGLNFKLFAPLIMETAQKATIMSPHEAQTGPMVRNDIKVMQMQLNLIDNELTKDIYKKMARSIYEDSLININKTTK